MTARILSGKKLSEAYAVRMTEEVALLREYRVVPRLCIIQVGEDPASTVYVRNKIRYAEAIGLLAEKIVYPDTVTEWALFTCIRRLNADPTVHGIIVQVPLPKGIDEFRVCEEISPLKDVDGFHPDNLGRMLLGTPRYLPATPAGVLALLAGYKIETAGRHVVVAGRSHNVGLPISILLGQKHSPGNATVTLCHTGSKSLEEIVRTGDIVISAMGAPKRITGKMLRPGAVVVDVGTSSVPDTANKTGRRIAGDVDYDSAVEVAAWISPVPGGVGPMTVSMLVRNTVIAAGAQSGHPIADNKYLVLGDES